MTGTTVTISKNNIPVVKKKPLKVQRVANFFRPLLDRYRRDHPDLGIVDKLRVVALQRYHAQRKPMIFVEKGKVSRHKQVSGGTNFFCSHLDEYRSDYDDLGTVEELSVVAFQWYQSRRDPIDLGRATAERSLRPV